MEPLSLPLEQGVNFRDLGGYQTKDGQRIKKNKVIRSGSLGNLSPNDLAFLDDYGLRYDVDFRSSTEQKDAPDRLPNGVNYYFTPVFPEDETKSSAKDRRKKIFMSDPEAGFKNMIRAYKDIVLQASAKKAYREFFDVLLANDKDKEAVLFHCSAGKDRTGMGAVYLLSVLGVDEKTIRNDYLASNKFLAPWTERELSKRKLPLEHQEVFLSNLKALGSVRESYLNTALTVMQREYGSLEGYLKHELYLTKQQVKDLKQIYLEKL
ncbi:tyrosine-protein phosphatase [Ligilactobacillus faecis]|uniref:Tyrosine-protein phosphatase n=1 Tax=Ligilactobacillus faecis TaxID=762833 RepID=A0ABV4DPE0_9LACO